MKELQKHRKFQEVHLILLDVWLEGSKKNGLQLLSTIKNYNPNIPVILISGHANIDIAVKAIKELGFEYILKTEIAPQNIWGNPSGSPLISY